MRTSVSPEPTERASATRRPQPRPPAGPPAPAEPQRADLLTVGRRLRFVREQQRLTLAELGAKVGCTASHLSTIENGRREPRLGLLHNLASALSVPVSELLRPEPPSRRAALEINLERAQRDPAYAELGLPLVHPGRRLPTDVLEVLVGLHAELRAQASRRLATPEEARRANVELRGLMRARDNYYSEIEEAVRPLLDSVGHQTGPLSHQSIVAIAERLGFTLHHVNDLPRSTRSVSDLRHRRIYLPRPNLVSTHDPRAIVLQTLGHFVLGHADPRDFGDFLRQRVEANYFAAAAMVPEKSAVEFLQRAKRGRDIAVEDLRDMFAVSYETAAHRFTNLATHHLGLRVHFMRVHESGTIYKAYENDGVSFPTDALGAIEGQLGCRAWAARMVFASDDRYSSFTQYTDTPSGTYWCEAHAEPSPNGDYAINVGVPYADARWFRGRDTARRMTSTCPDRSCCRQPAPALSARWDGHAWPSARAHSHLLAALPPGTFPGVDEPDVYDFLERHASDADDA